MTLGSDSDTAMSSMRPPMLAGPIDRKRKLPSSGSWDWLRTGSGGAAACPEPACPELVEGAERGAGAWACGFTDRPEIASAAREQASTKPGRKRLIRKVIESYTPGYAEGYSPHYDGLGAGAYLRRGPRGPAEVRSHKNPLGNLHAAERPDHNLLGRPFHADGGGLGLV